MLKVAGLHAWHVEAARWFGLAAPTAFGLTGKKNKGGGAAAHHGGRKRRQRGKEWGQEKPGRLGGAPIGGAGGRWAGKPTAAALPRLR